jgi:hypothetical protein
MGGGGADMDDSSLHFGRTYRQTTSYYFFIFFVSGKTQAEYNWQQDEEFSWNQIRDIDDEPKSSKSADVPFHMVAASIPPSFSAFRSSPPALMKAPINDNNLPLHGTK